MPQSALRDKLERVTEEGLRGDPLAEGNRQKQSSTSSRVGQSSMRAATATPTMRHRPASVDANLSSQAEGTVRAWKFSFDPEEKPKPTRQGGGAMKKPRGRNRTALLSRRGEARPNTAMAMMEKRAEGAARHRLESRDKERHDRPAQAVEERARAAEKGTATEAQRRVRRLQSTAAFVEEAGAKYEADREAVSREMKAAADALSEEERARKVEAENREKEEKWAQQQEEKKAQLESESRKLLEDVKAHERDLEEARKAIADRDADIQQLGTLILQVYKGEVVPSQLADVAPQIEEVVGERESQGSGPYNGYDPEELTWDEPLSARPNVNRPESVPSLPLSTLPRSSMDSATNDGNDTHHDEKPPPPPRPESSLGYAN